MPQIDPTAPCPCESGRPARGCCVFPGGALAREADTRPPGNLTGFAHSGCYAASLCDCSPKLSGEHYFSRNVLEELGERTVVVRGFPWQKRPAQRVGIRALEAKVLCERHNSALSPLDAQAGRLFRTLRMIEGDLRGGAGGEHIRLFAGIDVERWVLKTLRGLGSTGAVRAPSGDHLDWAPPELWCRILFGCVTFPSTWGLYVTGRIGAEANLDPGNVGISPLTTDDVVSGCLVSLAGFDFVAAVTNVTPRRTGALTDDSLYRPNSLRFNERVSGTTRYVCFSWTAGLVGGEVQLEWPARHGT